MINIESLKEVREADCELVQVIRLAADHEYPIPELDSTHTRLWSVTRINRLLRPLLLGFRSLVQRAV